MAKLSYGAYLVAAITAITMCDAITSPVLKKDVQLAVSKNGQLSPPTQVDNEDDEAPSASEVPMPNRSAQTHELEGELGQRTDATQGNRTDWGRSHFTFHSTPHRYRSSYRYTSLRPDAGSEGASGPRM